MTKRRRKPEKSDWQRAAFAQLKSVGARDSRLRISGSVRMCDNGSLYATITLDTSSIAKAAGGLCIGDSEDLLVAVPPSPYLPPQVFTGHSRFSGFPHVLQGHNLCIYLDPSREWDPVDGMVGFLNRLWAWLEDAAANRFDASEALYHPVGGVLHRTPGTPTVVVRNLDAVPSHQVIGLRSRNERRLDVDDPLATGERSMVFAVDHALPLGADNTLDGLLARLAQQGSQFLTMLESATRRNPAGTPQIFILSVPHPAGGPSHLLAGRIPAQYIDAIFRAEAATAELQSPVGQAPIEWCNISDERSCVTKRRDESKPVNGLANKNILVWGCGGLGSWIAEFVVRAGARRVCLHDPGIITGGLLVRQNFTENDIGADKASALATRLQAISDRTEIRVRHGYEPDDGDFAAADLIIDATVSIAVTRTLDAMFLNTHRNLWIAQVATDMRTGTLALLHVSGPSGPPLLALDDVAETQVRKQGSLEAYQRFWDEPRPGDELIPTRGCSVPTFHGSGADLAGLAAIMTTQIGGHLRTQCELSGTHLLSLPGAETDIAHEFLPWAADASVVQV